MTTRIGSGCGWTGAGIGRVGEGTAVQRKRQRAGGTPFLRQDKPALRNCSGARVEGGVWSGVAVRARGQTADPSLRSG
jgi:hypothetical protein